jgi:transcriptional regulator with XRE-family HTH domain
MYPNLKLQLWRSGIRQNRLARLLKIHETQLSKIVNGYRDPDPDMRARIAAILHSDEGWLFSPEEVTASFMPPITVQVDPKE